MAVSFSHTSLREICEALGISDRKVRRVTLVEKDAMGAGRLVEAET